MKVKSFVTALLLVFTMFSCSKYDDSEIWDYVKEMNSRLTALEEKCKEMNTNISSLQSIVSALENGDYITNVAPVKKDGAVIGYSITFLKSAPITIYNGTDGKDGNNGNDGYTPVMGVKQDANGLYYWTIDGEWLLNNDGIKVCASGIDGKDGSNGTNGITPQLKIESEYWYISYDAGTTWQMLGKATGDKGTDGASFFSSVTIGTSEVTFVLTDGATFSIPLQSSMAEYIAVDLGLPSGTKWANKNLGAQTECDYGDYYHWAFTIPYVWEYSEEREIKYTYNPNLDLDDDAAHVMLGEGWQIPSAEQSTELCTECSFRITTNQGILGLEVIGKNGKTIFLPAAGYIGGEGLCNYGTFGYYYLSTRRKEGTSWRRDALIFRLGYQRAQTVNMNSNYLGTPMTIRPVYKE